MKLSLIVLFLGMLTTTIFLSLEYPTISSKNDVIVDKKLMVNLPYQIQQQKELCHSLFPNNLDDEIECFENGITSYQLFHQLITTDTINKAMNECINHSLEELWINEKNTALWFPFMIDVMDCYLKKNP